MQKNKQMLTIESLKKTNSSFKFVLWIFIPLIFIFDIIFYNFVLKCNVFRVPILIMLVLMTIIFITILFLIMKKQNKQNFMIDNHDFKIVEDKIYDKYIHISSDSDGGVDYTYYIFTKIYGEMSVSSILYSQTQKNDSIYLLFYSGKELDYNSNVGLRKEYIKNAINIDQQYLASQYSLSQELQTYFIPYNETLGEYNFNQRIENQRVYLEKKVNKVICKNCGNEYKTKNYEECPICGTIYKFGIKDVVHEKGWY